MILLNVVWLVVGGCARTTCLIVSCSSIHRPNKTHKHVKTKRRTRQLLGHLGVQRVRLRGAVKDPLLPELGRARPPDHGRHALRDLVGAAGACIFAFGVWGLGGLVCVCVGIVCMSPIESNHTKIRHPSPAKNENPPCAAMACAHLGLRSLERYSIRSVDSRSLGSTSCVFLVDQLGALTGWCQ